MTGAGPVVVINPNSNTRVTELISAELDAFRHPGGPEVECLTMAEGPFGIENRLHVEQVTLPLARLVESRTDASAFVIACYSDPGLEVCRTMTAAPVFGIQEAGILTALARADMFGVLALSEGSAGRQRPNHRRMGVAVRCAGIAGLNISVEQSAEDPATFGKLVTHGSALKAQGAGALILGCAGMARHRKALAAELGLVVIDPTQAAVAMALGAVASDGS
ncbi:aspartate/glutamate racemase family protein [Psychromarinibacter halotolerans]|uniref:Aspartate/glutamate racemase family protein n=1 Tax=Psychromarinibacter halotolerans TaxID=1775175 RepID=A0ABV7GYC8_9RHOB|nr:aspartate/glutamate racemase family protein [Psychromarinibacter halotolerans]MDF0595197.1 aspartate/glutamate racemase family protein [Psychromarinibacter halotolerans]